MEATETEHQIHSEIGKFPYRMALAGGWIDQPFMSKVNPTPPGSVVVVGLHATCRFMDRAGMATSTRRFAREIWGEEIPPGDPGELVRQLYRVENEGKVQPSGSQDMAGLVYPGVNRLDYDYEFDGGTFPSHVESNNDPSVAKWLEDMVYLLPVAPRPDGYNPIEIKRLEPKWVQRLGQTGKDCFEAIIHKDLSGLGQSINECMVCWEYLLPQTVRHPAIQIDLVGLLHEYQSQYAGAMYSGCGGGYLIVVSDHEVPGGMKVKVRYR
jgi:hypothetical protein